MTCMTQTNGSVTYLSCSTFAYMAAQFSGTVATGQIQYGGNMITGMPATVTVVIQPAPPDKDAVYNTMVPLGEAAILFAIAALIAAVTRALFRDPSKITSRLPGNKRAK